MQAGLKIAKLFADDFSKTLPTALLSLARTILLKAEYHFC